MTLKPYETLIIFKTAGSEQDLARQAAQLEEQVKKLGGRITESQAMGRRRLAFRILQNRTLVKQLFAEIAPRYVDISGGYTRVMRLGFRRGDGAQQALLALSRLPAVPAPAKGPAPSEAPHAPEAPAKRQPAKPAAEEKEKPKGLFEGLRKIWTRKKKGAAAS